MSVAAAPLPIRVLLADDHEPTRRDVRRILEADGRFAVIAEAPDAAAAVSLALRRLPDLVVLDISMPGDGLSALWEISARLPRVKVVMLTVSEDDEHLFAALRCGASGYLLKDIDPRRMPEALHDVYLGRPAIPRRLVARVVDEFRDAAPRRRSVASFDELWSRLTSREWQVLDLLARDYSTAEIADQHVLTPSAVRAHITAIVRKLGARDRADAIARFRSSTP
jgi:DNA-binding NarL/FixJ family response regulator